MGTSAGRGAASSIVDSPAKLVRDPKKWLATDGQNIASAATVYNPQSAATLYGAQAISSAESGRLTGREVANAAIPGFDLAARGAQYATRGAGGTDTPPEIPVAPESATPERKRRSKQARAGTMLTDIGADLGQNLGTMGGRSTLLGL
jgi:hypothetical protein